MAELIAYFSRGDENYVNGEIKNLEIGNTEVAAGMIGRLTGADYGLAAAYYEDACGYYGYVQGIYSDYLLGNGLQRAL